MIKRRGRPPKTVTVTPDWEDLCKKLQQALEKQIDETEALENQRDLLSSNVLKLMGVVEYLERKNGNN
jgi:hypothetical protein